MTVFKNRPLALCCVLYAAVFYASLFAAPSVRITIVLLTALILFSVILICTNKNIKKISVITAAALALFAFLAVINSSVYGEKLKYAYSLDGGEYTCFTVVEDCTYAGENKRVLFRILAVDSEKCDFLAEGEFGEFEYGKYSEMIADITFSRFDKAGIYSEETEKRSDGILMKVSISDDKLKNADHLGYSESRDVTKNFFGEIREYSASVFDKLLPNEQAGFCSALMIGKKDNISRRIYDTFTYIGLPHVLAISGMHFSVIFGILSLILRMFTVPKKLRCLSLIGLSLLFTALCGFTASVSRACVMFIIVCLCDLISGKPDSFTSLCVAFFIIVIADPKSVYDMSFILSFSATLGIIVSLPICKKINLSVKFGRLVKFILLSCVVSVFAISFTVPAMYVFFGSVSALGILSNLLAAPFLNIIMYLCLFLLLLSPVGFIARYLSSLLCFSCRILFWICDALRSADGAVMTIDTDISKIIITVFALIFTVAVICDLKHRSVYLLLSVMLICTLYADSFIYRQRNKEYLTECGTETRFEYFDGTVIARDDGKSDYDALKNSFETFRSLGQSDIDTFYVSSFTEEFAASIKYFTGDVSVGRIKAPLPKSSKDLISAAELAKTIHFSGIPVEFE